MKRCVYEGSKNTINMNECTLSIINEWKNLRMNVTRDWRNPENIQMNKRTDWMNEWMYNVHCIQIKGCVNVERINKRMNVYNANMMNEENKNSNINK